VKKKKWWNQTQPGKLYKEIKKMVDLGTKTVGDNHPQLGFTTGVWGTKQHTL